MISGPGSAKRTVLLVGSGGREHAMAWKLTRSPRVGRFIVAPGSDAFAAPWERWTLESGHDGFLALAKRARAEGVDLAVIGPDNPLAEGIVDILEAAGIPCFGPSAGAAQIEASKAFAKEVMNAAGVPTAQFRVARSADEAEAILRELPWNGPGWVVKADGLALGKGVKVCAKLGDAIAAARELLSISGELVIEECLVGSELSWLALCDGERCALLEPARDHKRLLDRDEGPNTGGMGAYSPVPGISREWAERVRAEVFLPTLKELRRRGVPFKGVLYAGLMIDFSSGRYWVLEFNARFGDPETQVLLPRMNADLFDWCEAVARGDLSGLPTSREGTGDVPFYPESAVTVVAASSGYPEKPLKGIPIDGPIHGPARATVDTHPSASSPEIPPYFLAGAAKDPEKGWVTSGGRVLCANGMGPSFEQAREAAYRNLSAVKFEGMQFRKDIGGVR